MDRLVSQKAPWLAQTKFHIPQIRGDSITRQRLSAWLGESVASTPITFVSAPAGYGKTTLLATLQNGLDERPIAWLSLDEEEDDLNAFLFALIGALQTLKPRCGAATLDLLPFLINPDGPQDGRVEVRRLMGILINEIQESFEQPLLLVLDDLHFITNPLTLAALDYLLERMPDGMRIVMATRRDPPLSLPRYRARRRLAELRLTDLRFTVTETGDLLNEALELDVPVDAVETLQARTEGWAAGLSLLANSLEHMPPGERVLFIEQLARTHQETFDYLSDEVLRRQPQDLQTFLLQTSILHTLTPQQCTAVVLLQLAVDAGIRADYAGWLLAQLLPEPTAEDEPALPDDFAPLTEREMEVLRLIAAGASNKAIAEELVISMPTVKSHVSHILSKLNVSSRGQAGARARELDLV